MPRFRLTSPVQKQIISYIRLGCYDWLAAEAVGVPRLVFSDWLQRGQAGARAYRELALQVLQAKAQARAVAEMAAFKLNPLSWLRYGPGRETGAEPGWTVSVRPLVTTAQANALESVPVLELLQALDHALRGHPEAREAVLHVLDRLPSQTSIRSRRKNKGEAS